MQTFDYTRPRATAERLIARFGKAAVLRKSVAADPDPYDPDAGTTSSEFTAIEVVELNSELRDATGTLIDQTSHKLLVSTAAGVEPQDEDAVAIGLSTDEVGEGTIWLMIAKVLPLAPGSMTLLYEITLES
ncbi:hypothetical protein [Aureimonas glaciei]|uniref:Uncharacterized protein n=1 Tax=Aureimonas glaciei TaxID=1776957 RepID=A0A916YFS9_9HYPH|nr:hypothetical protein [Aureimonas glaciei]GGD43473.1 hypothetical protein GCM10011335_52630 [Aureimonas glaciei]